MSDKNATTVLDLIQLAENRAMAIDGPVPPDHEMLDDDQLIDFFRAAYVLAKQTERPKEAPKPKTFGQRIVDFIRDGGRHPNY